MSEEIFESGTQDRPRPHPRGEAHVHQEESVSEVAVQDDASTVDDDEPEFNEEEFLQLRHKLALLNQDKDALERIADEMNKEVEKKQEIILDLRLRNATLTKAVKSVQQETEARDAVVNALYAEIDALKAQLARRVAYVPAYTREKDEDDERSEAAPQPPKASAKTSAEEQATPLDSAVVSEIGTERAELLERVARLQMDMDRERKRRQEAEDTIEEAVSRVRELEREAAEHNAQDFVPPPLSNEIPEERGLTPMEQKHLFVRVIKLVSENDDLTEELRTAKSHLAMLRSRMELVRQQMQKRDGMYQVFMQEKDKKKKAELLDNIQNSAVVTYRLLTLEDEDFE